MTAARPRGFLTLADIAASDWPAVWDRCAQLEDDRKSGKLATTLAGKTIALVFEKASTRTRVSFEVAAYELGGNSVLITSEGSQIARGEPAEDTARVLSSYCHAIVIRTFGQERVATFAKAASVPVVNGLSDQHHPCQVATDLYTVRQHFGRIDGLRYAWIGDGNNMAQSWLEAAGMFGLDLVLACPEGFAPDPQLVKAARTAQQQLGKGSIELTTDPAAAAAGAHVMSTDVWASMGQESEAARRRIAFKDFRIDGALVDRGDGKAIVLHCLPAHRGEEITGDVLDGPRSLAWVQAANRLHIAKAVLERVFQ
ncbi:MAG: ornithine carbamoyltransferase [Deltaproteobacteria bacterium]|nr:ornithine carbamoyltransferase [Deltaproteobacteria bacterium]MDQ3297897.1 ornithine carbamoyltransferase [Myxococcota bacterium]